MGAWCGCGGGGLGRGCGRGCGGGCGVHVGCMWGAHRFSSIIATPRLCSTRFSLVRFSLGLVFTAPPSLYQSLPPPQIVAACIAEDAADRLGAKQLPRYEAGCRDGWAPAGEAGGGGGRDGEVEVEGGRGDGRVSKKEQGGRREGGGREGGRREGGGIKKKGREG